jgi:phosphoglycerate dehydrogenase-like enzyme
LNDTTEHLKVVLVDLDGHAVPDWICQDLKREGIELTIAPCSTRADLAANAADADVVWMFGGSRILTNGNLAAARRCWAIVRTGSGTDNVPVDEATSRRILVANTPAAFSDAVSDHVIALLFAAGRRIAELDRGMRLGRWDQATAIPLNSVQGRTLSLVGFGHIARAVRRKLSGFEMNVLVHDPLVRAETIVEHGARPVSLEAALAEADYLSLHCPLTQQTRHLMGERQLRSMKPTAVLINTSRGPVVDERFLLQALTEGWIAAAGLDVFEEEPLGTNHPLAQLDNVVLTPHCAGYSANGVELRWRMSLETIVALAHRRWPPSCVNPDVKPARELSR